MFVIVGVNKFVTVIVLAAVTYLSKSVGVFVGSAVFAL